MEVWDVYDKYRNITGKKILKSQRASLKIGEYETVVHVGIFNSDSELLIQKRQSFKETSQVRGRKQHSRRRNLHRAGARQRQRHDPLQRAVDAVGLHV